MIFIDDKFSLFIFLWANSKKYMRYWPKWILRSFKVLKINDSTSKSFPHTASHSIRVRHTMMTKFPFTVVSTSLGGICEMYIAQAKTSHLTTSSAIVYVWGACNFNELQSWFWWSLPFIKITLESGPIPLAYSEIIYKSNDQSLYSSI